MQFIPLPTINAKFGLLYSITVESGWTGNVIITYILDGLEGETRIYKRPRTHQMAP